MEVLEAIRMKRAVRAFSPEPLAQDRIQTILDAGRRAQSSKNTQPWHFIAIQDKQILQGLSTCGTYAGHLEGAALGVAILTPDPAQRWSIMFDAGQAAAYMQLAAWSLGIGSCLATIYDTETARQLLGYPDDLHLHVALSFGFPADEEDLTRSPKPGGRRQLADLTHLESW
jgi:nitroreductase